MMQFASSRTHNTHSLRAPRSVIALDTLLCFAWLFLSVSCVKRCGVVEVRSACVCLVTQSWPVLHAALWLCCTRMDTVIGCCRTNVVCF